MISMQGVTAYDGFDIVWLSNALYAKISEIIWRDRDETGVLSAGNVQSSLSQSQRRDCHQVGDVRSHASRSLYRGRQSDGQSKRHARLSGGRHRLCQWPVFWSHWLRHRRAEPRTSQLQAVFEPTHHVSRGGLLMSLRLPSQECF